MPILAGPDLHAVFLRDVLDLAPVPHPHHLELPQPFFDACGKFLGRLDDGGEELVELWFNRGLTDPPGVSELDQSSCIPRIDQSARLLSKRTKHMGPGSGVMIGQMDLNHSQDNMVAAIRAKRPEITICFISNAAGSGMDLSPRCEIEGM
ncbi:uncharacterized protein PG998_006676 [Apiospora kogelbergensis]|uniref:uncharacterized protein n=1 Tax=Apiospora kogelbergensis TaxID=1337665 RepID=UPI0031323E85